MKFMALISGGKDSFFSIQTSVEQGHELVALANLYPSVEKDDIDSFMFQTVGHDIVDFYRQCVDVPLYRRPIYGTSANQDLEYRQTPDDEIEDLAQLVADVLRHHPDVQGVSSGAILAAYQRTRVENVCGRYGLTSLAYLWQMDQTALMGEMCASGLDARLIKVAAIGLEARHLGKSLQEVYPYLLKLNGMYDVHVCGEGGEFETLVLDAEWFDKRLEITDSQVISVPGDVAYLRVKVKVVDKEKRGVKKIAKNTDVCLLEEDFVELAEACQPCEVGETGSGDPTPPEAAQPYVAAVANNLYVCNVAADSPEDLFAQLESLLAAHNCSFDNIQHMTLLVSDMSDFASINKVYATKFVNHLPPSRVCVQTSLAKRLQLSCKCIIDETTKRGVHVRSRSFWAPQNIGPYSQCRVEESPELSLASVSGQIPLVPATMELYQADHVESTVLALQHFHKVKKLVNVREIASILCFITDKVSPLTVSGVWKEYCSSIDSQKSIPRLTIVRVETLPLNALVEWGGDTYRQTETAGDDDEQEDDQDVVEWVSRSSPGATVTRLHKFVQVAFFADSGDDIERFQHQTANFTKYTKIACNYDDFHTIKHLSFEHLPVLDLWDAGGAVRKFSVVANIQW